jgi:DNA-binding response OmpR family regulator
MIAEKVQTILIVEDESTVRKEAIEKLDLIGTVIEAEHMEQARNILNKRWDEIALIIMDIMLPKNEEDSKQIKNLLEEREKIYDKWIDLEDEGCSKDDPELIKIRFEVDAFDNKIFSILENEGGIWLIQECISKYGTNGKLSKPVLYLTARETESVCRKGLELLASDMGKWLIKPASPEQIETAVKLLLTKVS